MLHGSSHEGRVARRRLLWQATILTPHFVSVICFLLSRVVDLAQFRVTGPRSPLLPTLIPPRTEGRLVLGDGVAYAAKDLGATTIVDIATLTGAQGIATGKRHAAVLADTAELEAAAVAAGRASGDLVFPVPYCPEFFLKEFATPAAGMLNSVRDRSNAQVSCAGSFIGAHLPAGWAEGGGRWLHVDCAAPAEGGTGYGVAQLVELLRSAGKAATA